MDSETYYEQEISNIVKFEMLQEWLNAALITSNINSTHLV